eukprot:TRINITY_DN68038_c5_g6_i1.p1 TRINITY_DN68038_c5_g6~~TRINITY_DN68038_c5_g6_i1.p1  ORF type:complete len:468 (-),score=31.32 TRINITY_DN68038_c5_g6_i1:116-1519(-)
MSVRGWSPAEVETRLLPVYGRIDNSGKILKTPVVKLSSKRQASSTDRLYTQCIKDRTERAMQKKTADQTRLRKLCRRTDHIALAREKEQKTKKTIPNTKGLAQSESVAAVELDDLPESPFIAASPATATTIPVDTTPKEVVTVTFSEAVTPPPAVKKEPATNSRRSTSPSSTASRDKPKLKSLQQLPTFGYDPTRDEHLCSYWSRKKRKTKPYRAPAPRKAKEALFHVPVPYQLPPTAPRREAKAPRPMDYEEKVFEILSKPNNRRFKGFDRLRTARLVAWEQEQANLAQRRAEEARKLSEKKVPPLPLRPQSAPPTVKPPPKTSAPEPKGSEDTTVTSASNTERAQQNSSATSGTDDNTSNSNTTLHTSASTTSRRRKRKIKRKADKDEDDSGSDSPDTETASESATATATSRSSRTDQTSNAETEEEDDDDATSSAHSPSASATTRSSVFSASSDDESATDSDTD